MANNFFSGSNPSPATNFFSSGTSSSSTSNVFSGANSSSTINVFSSATSSSTTNLFSGGIVSPMLNLFSGGQPVVSVNVFSGTSSSPTTNFFNVSQSVIQNLRYIPQYETKPSASAFAIGTLVYDITERNFYEATATGWSVYFADEITTDTLNATTVNLTTLNGQPLSYYLDWANTTNKPDPTITLSGDVSGSVTLTDLSSGTITTFVTETAVTQHEAAINISASQVSNFTSAVQSVVTESFVESLGIDAVAIDYDPTGVTLISTNVQSAIDELDIKKVDIASLASNINFYYTSASASIGSYFKLVTDLTDPDFDVSGSDVSVGTITTTNQLLAGFVSEPGLIEGNPGVVALTTLGQIRRTGGSGTAKFYFRVFQRTSGGTETEIALSGDTIPIDSNTYSQYAEYALLSNVTFLSTDRIVIKWYADRVSGGSNPTYEIRIGGSDPTRTLFPVPLSVIPGGGIAANVLADTSSFNTILSASDDTVQKALNTLDDHTHALGVLSDVSVSGAGGGDVLAFDSSTSTWTSLAQSSLDAGTLDGKPSTDFLRVYNPIVRQGSWSRIARLDHIALFGSVKVSIHHTRNSVVVGCVLQITFGHSGHGQITQIGSHGYTQVGVRLTNVDANNRYLEILDNGTGTAGADNTYTVYMTDIACGVTEYTSYTAGGGTVSGEITTENNQILIDSNKVWHSGNDGTGSGLDADTVDGVQAGSFVRSDADDNKTGFLEFQDNAQLRFGNDADMQIYFDGSHLYFKNFNHANGNIYFQGEDAEGTNHALLYLMNNTSTPYVNLYYNGGLVLNTRSGGIDVSGDIYLDDQIIHNGDEDTYMQFHSNDQWRVVTGGVERIEISNTDIRTTQPILMGTTYIYPARAWVTFRGTSTVLIRRERNVGSITDYGTGYYGVNFFQALPSTTYSASLSCPEINSCCFHAIIGRHETVAQTTTQFRIRVRNHSAGTDKAAQDMDYISAAFFDY